MEDLAWLVREHLHEPARLLARRPPEGRAGALGRGRAAAGLLRGGLAPAEVAEAVRESGARVVHAHNLLPDARLARAGRRTRAGGARRVAPAPVPPGVRHRGVLHARERSARAATGATRCRACWRNCRGSRAEALAYGAGLALWQRRTLEQVDAVVVPSEFARERLRALGAPLPWERVHVLAPPLRTFARRPRARRAGSTRWWFRAWRPRRGSTWRSRRAAARACRSSSRAMARSWRRCALRRARARCASWGAWRASAWRSCAVGRRSRWCPRARRRPSGWRRRRRWQRACRWPGARWAPWASCWEEEGRGRAARRRGWVGRGHRAVLGRRARGRARLGARAGAMRPGGRRGGAGARVPRRGGPHGCRCGALAGSSELVRICPGSVARP